MKTIAIIPARGGSKRLPEKNILMLGGIPLLAHSILYAQKNSKYIDAIYVSTDDAAIKQVALKYGAIVIDRPVALSGDLEPTISAVQQVLETLNDSTIENIILLQPTNPLRPEQLFQDAFDLFQSENHDSLFTVSRNHQKLGKITNKKFIPFNYKIGQRSQDLEPLFYENGLLYITKAQLIQAGKIISDSGFPYLVNHAFAEIDIDNQKDFDYAEYLFKVKNLKL
jgi:N-acylneuraminate cytidylyltransferase